jgi:2-polyprenyl-3-methyl-5-hydroxy-6-metoxy-1,4-benzoquinol methylase
MDVEKYYDDYADLQSRKGINHRHLSIQRWLESFGLNPKHSVLEVGCGIGTQSELILRYLSKDGRLLGADISPRSIEIAKDRLRKYSNSSFEVFDFTQNLKNEKFQVIVMPDVIEHIPINLHPHLFKNLDQMLVEDGFILIHIPDPNYLEWCIQNTPEILQIIDQPIHTSILSKNLLDTELYISFLQSYSIYQKDCDYQVIVLKKKPKGSYDSSTTPLHDSISRRMKRKVKYLLRNGK